MPKRILGKRVSPTSFRLTEEEIARIDQLACAMVEEGFHPLCRTEVVRVGIAALEKRFEKKLAAKTNNACAADG